MIPSQNSWEWLGAPKVVIIKGDSLRGQLATTFACQLDWGSRQTEQLEHGPLRSTGPLLPGFRNPATGTGPYNL